MHNSETVLENEMLKILWNFEVQTVHVISAKRLHLEIIKKKTQNEKNLLNSGLCRFGEAQ